MNLQIYGDKRLSVANESDEAFQNRILSIAKAISEGNVKRIRSYLFSLEDSFRVSVLSQYIKNAEPSTELYDLFMDYYKLTDYGFKNLYDADIRKVLSGKSEEQKKKTAEKLQKFPDTVTVYRGEGSKSTPYTQSFSWTVSYKAASFFACRLPSAEDSTIVSAEVSKNDIIEFFPERNEAEVVILPSAVKSVKVDTLYGLESVEEEILEITDTAHGINPFRIVNVNHGIAGKVAFTVIHLAHFRIKMYHILRLFGSGVIPFSPVESIIQAKVDHILSLYTFCQLGGHIRVLE